MLNKNSYLIDYFWLFVAIAIFFGFMLGCRALSVPDEARYSEIPREMLLFHDFITPHLDGVKYFEKPPFLYWVQSGMIALFGINEWALRLPTAFMGLLGCLATYTVGHYFFNRATGIISAVILATSPLYFGMARSITLDMAVTFWLTLTLFSFIVAVDLPWHSKARRNVCWLMYVAAALAVLTKGLIGVVLPGVVAFSWLLIFNRWRELKQLHLVSGILLFLAIALPWHILVQLKNPEFFNFYFIEQHFTRFLTKAMGRYKPIWWFIPILFVGIFPWVFFLPQALRFKWSERAQYQREIFFMLWAIEIFIFFSLSDSKLIPYILPVLPPLALLLAKFLQAGFQVDAGTSLSPHQRSMNISLKMLSVFSLLVIVGVLSTPFWKHVFTSAQAMYLYFMMVPFLLMLILPWFKWDLTRKILAVFLAQVLLLWSLIAAIPAFDLRPIKSLALQIKQLAKPNDIVASYGLYYQDLPVYTKRLVLIVSWKNELSFGYAHQPDAKERLIDQDDFWKIWQQSQRVFAVMDQNDFQNVSKKYPMYVIGTHDDDLLVSNKP
jgi:4-amino-4-deoxy-L-arabinose transferase-like glycosyltransferase